MKLCNFEVGLNKSLFLIAGPCVIESEQLALDTAGQIKEICLKLGIPFIYKSSYDKANRSSGKSFRGFGMDAGLKILDKVKTQINVPVLTDVHSIEEIAPVASVVDVLQTPAFLCRQTDFIQAVASAGRPVKRGASFGYNNLVSDMRSLAVMRNTGCPVVFDATHSVQLPGGQGAVSGGQREFVPVLARAAVAAGISGLFMETHPNPAQALSDGPNAFPLGHLEALLHTLKVLDETVKAQGLIEENIDLRNV